MATRRYRVFDSSTSGFYPRHPRGWRLFSIVDVVLTKYVSIHATLAGGDAQARDFGRCSCCFYPRHPRGWRRRHKKIRIIGDTFLSTPPSRVATPRPNGNAKKKLRFYPRHPRGWRLRKIIISVFFGCFYPRHPRGWRPFAVWPLPITRVVSIHATLAGGDSFIF